MISPRLGRAIVLAAWAAFFAALWLTDETTRYLGPRTSWVVTFGTITLCGAAVVYGLAALRTRHRAQALSVREALGLLVLLVPILAVLTVPRAELGALAAKRKTTNRAVASQRPTGGEVSFAEIDYARYSPGFAEEAGIKPGRHVQLIGFVVTSSDAPGGAFELGRFYISCCAADALPTLVAIDPAGVAPRSSHPTDTWLRVSGRLARRGDEFIVRAEAIEPAEAPENPYLYLD
jgi:putative membrane protein